MIRKGFTLIELLVVIAIIGLLSSIAVVSTNSVRDKAKIVKANADLVQIVKQIEVARNNNNLPLISITANGCSDCNCRGKYLPTLASSDTCITILTATFLSIGFSGLLRDPWGSPYLIDENEMEAGACGTHDALFSAGPNGYDSIATGDDISIEVPFFQCR